MPNTTVAIAFDEKKIDAIFADLDQGQLPGAAVGIAIGGKPVYRRGFGLASMELPVVLSPTIRMSIGSTTKHFAALAYMLLCENGKATIDDPIGKYLPELHPVTHPVTMRQLMGHVGGLRDAFDICFQFSGTGRRVSSEDILSLYRDIDDVNFAPGTGWNYNNGGYMMLSAAIERITGQSLEEVLRERIFVPVGMHDTLLRRFNTDVLPNSATSHMTKPTGGFEKSHIGTAVDGCGGMFSTIDDMLRWLAHMDAPRVGKASTWALMKTPQILANGFSTGYGLGLMDRRHRGIATLGHGGNLMGASAQMLKVPGAGLDVMVMANRYNVSAAALADKILEACLPGLDPIEDASESPIASGLFRSPTSGRVIQLSAPSPSDAGNKEAQQIASIDGTDFPLERHDGGALRLVSFMDLALTLIGDQETPGSILFSDFGNLDELVAVKPAVGADGSAIAGRYRSNPTATEATIFRTDTGPRLETLGRFGSAECKLECLADGIWRATSTGAIPWSGVLSFDRDGVGFRFSSLRTPALPFRRRE
jgi:CubicO group peptidase (beta-lactamase class C family)